MSNIDKVLTKIVDAGLKHRAFRQRGVDESQNDYAAAWVGFVEEVRAILSKGR
jgi:hypothetical protein